MKIIEFYNGKLKSHKLLLFFSLITIFLSLFQNCSGFRSSTTRDDFNSGSGSLADSNPGSVPNSSSLKSISVGSHSCLIKGNDGRLDCWGRNSNGEVGTGTNQDVPVPTYIIRTGVQSVSVGNGFTCAVVNQSLNCWGINRNGQLGDNTTIDRSTPNETTSSTGVISVSAGGSRACAIYVGGELKCWGYNIFAVGDQTYKDRIIPVGVIASGVSAVSVGYEHTCAILNGGVLQCWGSNSSGQLGDGTSDYRSTPKTIIASGVTSVATGFSHTCAVVNSAVLCWGDNRNYQVGSDSRVPKIVIPMGATDVAVGGAHSCALVKDSLVCWGSNMNGELANGNTETSYFPSTSISSGVKSVFAGGNSTCIINDADVYQCWGR